jgi:hypothetical protein
MGVMYFERHPLKGMEMLRLEGRKAVEEELGIPVIDG